MSGARRRRAAGAALACLVGAALCACRPPPHPPTPCSLRAPAAEDAATASERIPAAVWLDLLVPDHRDVRDPLAALHTCTGAPLRVDSSRHDAQVLPSGEPAPVRIAAVDEARALMWAPLRDYDDGDALGPIVLLRRHDPGDSAHLEILAIGALRAPRAAQLRLEALADGGELVVAEGARCEADVGEEARCVRELQLLPRSGERLVDAALRSGDVEGPARIAAALSVATPIPGGLRAATLERSLRGDPEGVRIVEVLRVRRCVGAAGEGCDDVATIRRERPLRFDGERLLAPASLWTPEIVEGGLP
ncbi:MAG: hypothetical protein R3A79_00855 [Nannocystaceae bacterium]